MAKMPSLGAVKSKLASLVADQGDFAESAEEIDAKGDQPQDTPQIASEAPVSDETPAEAPSEAPVAAEAPQPPETPEAPTAPVVAPVEDWVDVEYADEDTGDKYVVRAKKDYADKVKNGYARKSAMSRATGYLSKYKGTPLGRLIQEGKADDLAAIAELGERDVEFRNAIYDAYYRRATGRPITFADQIAQQQVAPTQQPTQVVEDGDDPLGLKQLVREAYTPLQQELAAIRSQQDTAEQQRRQAYAWQQANAQAEVQTVSEFTNRFPGEYTGNSQTDMPKYTQVLNYAKNAGLFDRYGATNNPSLYPAIMVMAKLEMDNNTYAQAPPSTAMSAAQAAEQAERQSREAAAALAASQGGGNASAPAPVQKKREKPPLVDDKGKKLNLKQIARYYEQSPA